MSDADADGLVTLERRAAAAASTGDSDAAAAAAERGGMAQSGLMGKRNL